ncbi:HugZ family protein [Rhizobium sp. SSA_523]|uniref:HugZ family pyridoxamine 5'-phosphate oxidase n=1 Tax=Rhizobium sp. SSA_523 TaxID=2952477 RepID=UPI0020919207|nr:pyridoxamine 5'-phosphate oxidase family protein [Rhizobium sp. SSA_523]MCO5730480.1 pyridoxamine 5'-phosphate oxidase family protein [Rhizobium sp. SSA_523]WKC25519.1 pyridoxamine 5'-phosphate oxidase family protein [Rhizobium sp. SSA_523]
MTDKPSVLRDLDPEALTLGRTLLRSARSVALAVQDAASGFPAVSRALMATDLDGTPLILVSTLAAHTRSLAGEPRCSLLAGEPGKGDPLAHPRVTLFALAEPVPRGSQDHDRARRRFLNRHPKSALYIDFPDFSFYRLRPDHASLNGGFGRAYAIDGGLFTFSFPLDQAAWLAAEEGLMNGGQDATALARAFGAPKAEHYRICGMDPAGIDISGTDPAGRDRIYRHEFDDIFVQPDDAIDELMRILGN